MTTRRNPAPGASLVVDALSALAPEHRVVVVRTCYRGESVTELSDALGLPRDVVKSRLQQGLHALRLALRDNGAMEA